MLKPAKRLALTLIATMLAGGCATAPQTVESTPGTGKLACDSFFIYDLCVQDVSGDGRADMLYFDDTDEIFMYREGMDGVVTSILPLHRCARQMSPDTADYSTALLHSEQLTLLAEMDVKRKLLTNYMAAKPEVDVCMEATATASSAAVSQDSAEDFLSDNYDW